MTPNIYPTTGTWLGIRRELNQKTHPDNDLIKILCFPPVCNNIVTHIVVYGCYNLHIDDIAVCQHHMTSITKQNCVTCGQPIAKIIYKPWHNDYYERYTEQ
jgi:hypothetical protein